MNKYAKIFIIAVFVIATLVLAFLVSGKQTVKVISYDEYAQISKSEGFVYYGSQEEKSNLKQISQNAGIEIAILDSKKTKKEKLIDKTLYQYKDGKMVFKYTGDLTSYKLQKALMKEKIIDKTYLEISLADYKKIIKSKGKNLMFIGSEQCGYCTQFKDSINETLKTEDYNIYYIDIASLTETEYQELVATDKYMSENEWGTPLTLFYKNGKRKDVLSGYVDAKQLTEFLKKNKVI